ncbi:MAG TPA: aminoglycoside adenylyltransferase domain-containing protein [Longimicrobiaceae bacterium]|nr:aminoglycoside adenylyltransferase domain-containing protein [Longimicrobiaceae bacterium]
MAALLDELLAGVRAALGTEMVGVYVSGSLAAGGFDRASDVDVVVVTETEVRGQPFETLDAMHQRLAQLDVWCATELECTYISLAALRRFDPARAVHAILDRGRGERLKLATYDEGWVVHCHTLRRQGITLAGPDPATLIDEVTPAALRQAMRGVLAGWAADLLAHPGAMGTRGYQSYVVLSLCRIRYTLATGDVVPKPQAAAWACERLSARWHPLIDRALVDRQNPAGPASDEDVRLTLDLIRDTIDAERAATF